MTGAAARDAALDLLERTRAAFLAEARRHALEIAQRQGLVTIDDVRHACPPPEGIDPRVMGAVFRRSLFVAVGFTNSTRRVCHSRPVRVFRLQETAA